MAHVLASSSRIRFKLELCGLFLYIGLQSRHSQDENAIAVCRIGQAAADRLWQADVTVVRTHCPLGDERFGLIVA
jgi:hypothetical protein